MRQLCKDYEVLNQEDFKRCYERELFSLYLRKMKFSFFSLAHNSRSCCPPKFLSMLVYFTFAYNLYLTFLCRVKVHTNPKYPWSDSRLVPLGTVSLLVIQFVSLNLTNSFYYMNFEGLSAMYSCPFANPIHTYIYV